MDSKLILKLADKSLTKEELCAMVERDFQLLPEVLVGVSSSKPTIRYGCAKVLMDLSAKAPLPLYPHFNEFAALLESKHRILVWNALAILANLCAVDEDKRFDAIFDKYYGFLGDPYMVTVANVVGNSSKIAVAKPYLIPKITRELLRVSQISPTPHLTEECKRVITEKAIESFGVFFDGLDAEQKKQVIAFSERHVGSSRKSLSIKAAEFLKRVRSEK